MSNEITERTVKTRYIIMATSILFRGLQFLCERENSVHQRSVVLRTELQQTYLWTKFRWFASLHEGRMSPAILAQVWWLKSGSLPLLSLATDASMVRERYWLLQGEATQQNKQKIENKSDNCILSTIIMCSLDTPSWQEIQIKPPDVLHRGAWTGLVPDRNLLLDPRILCLALPK